MKLVRLTIENFRGLAHADLRFGAGLNVLYGPNDLGKSTVAEAIRAALLLQAGSSKAKHFRPWGRDLAPEVALTFLDPSGAHWRVKKTFAGTGSTELEHSRDGRQWTVEGHGRGVEGKLVELLRWGTEPPGKKGGAGRASGKKHDARGVPTSFLARAFLGEQADADAFLARSLSDDPTEDARERLIATLGAYTQDPAFKEVLGLAQARVALAYTPTGREAKGKGSPWNERRQELREANARVEQLREAVEQSGRVELAVTKLREDELRAKQRVETIAEERARLAAAQAALVEHKEAASALAHVRRLEAELGATRAAVEERSARQADLAAELARANEALVSAQARLATAEEARRALLESGRAVAAFERSERSRDLERAQQALRDAQRRHAEGLEVVQAVERVVAIDEQLAEARRALDALDVEDAELATARERHARELAALRLLSWESELRVAEAAQGSADAATREAERIAAEASKLRRDARSRRAEAERAIGDEELASLEALEAELRAAQAAREVGISVAVLKAAGVVLAASVDDASPVETPGEERALEFESRSRVRLELRREGELLAEIQVLGGDAAAQRRAREAGGRWEAEARPLLSRYGVESLADARAQRAAARQALADAPLLEQQAQTLDQQVEAKRAEAQRTRPSEERLAALRESLAADASDVPDVLAALRAELAGVAAEVERSTWLARRREEGELKLRALEEDGRDRERVRLQRDHALQRLEEERARELASASALLGDLARPPEDQQPAQLGLGFSEPGEGEGDGGASSPMSPLAVDPAPEVLLERVHALRASLADELGRAKEREREAQAHLDALDAAETDTQLQASEANREAAVREVEAGELALRRADDALRQGDLELHEARGAFARAEAATQAYAAKGQLDPRLATDALAARAASARAALEEALRPLARRLSTDTEPELDELGATLRSAAEELAREESEAAEALRHVSQELHREQGALREVGGEVLRAELTDAQAAREAAEARAHATQLEYEGWRMLAETLQEVEQAEGAQLGNALAAPLSERFGALLRHVGSLGGHQVSSRYGGLTLGADFGEARVRTNAGEHEVTELSVGTREQLAALMRVHLAEELGTFCVLDDQLTHTDPERLRWFSQQLRAAAHKTQVLVLTCHPLAYLRDEELVPSDSGEGIVERAAGFVRALDATRLLVREPPPNERD